MKRILLLCLIVMLSACTEQFLDEEVTTTQAVCQVKDIRVMLLPATVMGTTDEVSCTKYKLFLGNEYMGEYDADKYVPVNATVELNLSNGTQYNKTVLANYGEQYDALVYKDTKCNGTKVYAEKVSFVVPCNAVYKVTARLMEATQEYIERIWWQERRQAENIIYATPGEYERFDIVRTTAPGGTQFNYIACDWDRTEIESIETQRGDSVNRRHYHDNTWKIIDNTQNAIPFIVKPRYNFNSSTKITCYLQDEDFFVVPALYPYLEKGVYDYYLADVGLPNQKIDIEVRKR